MAYETYPKKSGQGKSGATSGWGSGTGVSYPGKSLASKQDDTGTVHCSVNSGNGASPPGSSYPKGRLGCEQFPELAGLPS